MKKGIILILMLVLCSLGYAKDKVEEIVKKGVLRVGTTADYKPFTYKSGEEYKGYDMEVAKLLAKELGVELEIVPTTWKTLLEDLKADKYDILWGE